MDLTTSTNKNSNNKECTDNVYTDKIRFIKALNPNFWLPFVATSLILLVVVVFITDYNMAKSELVIGSQVAERGKRTILLYEAIASGEIQLDKSIDQQDLIANLGNQDDFLFLAITDGEGKFLAHSDPKKRGTHISTPHLVRAKPSFMTRIISLLPHADKEGTNWGFVEIDGERLFLVHRIFSESVEQGKIRTKHPEINKTLEKYNVRHVFAAIQPSPLQNALMKYRKTSFVMASWVIGISFFALCFLMFLYRAVNGRKRMSVAESTIVAMHEEVQRLEAEIQKQEKLVAIGNLAAAVAHEIRNPLSSIKGYATYFASIFPKESANQKTAQIIISEVERVNLVIGDLIGVSRPTDIKTESVSIKSIITATVQLLSQDAKQLGIELNILGTDSVIFVDPYRLRQALINIILNAIEAFKEKDFIDKMTEAAKVDIVLSDTKTHVNIDIIDNGPGIDETILRRIFDPYFTTKNRGTGLGLVNSYKIIEAHAGSLTVKSEEEKGTTFSIKIPKNNG